jgi:hypothetical protein
MRNLSFEFYDCDFKGVCKLLEVEDPHSEIIGGTEDVWFLQVLPIILGGEGLRSFENHRDEMMDSFNNVPSGIEIYHSLYKELTPHTMMNRLKAAQNMVNTSTLDGKIDLRGPPTRFITKIRESMRQ